MPDNRAINADAAELAKFEAAAPGWWGAGKAFQALHDINPLRLGFIRQRVDLAGRDVVDVGCGMGHFSIGMARLVGDKGKVVAIDMQQKMLDVTLKRASRAGVADGEAVDLVSLAVDADPARQAARIAGRLASAEEARASMLSAQSTRSQTA